MVVGLMLTGLGGAIHAMGFLGGLERLGFDLHVRFFSSVPADPRITLIVIDDSTIQTIGEWPWPRRRHAELVRTLHDLGAKLIVLDVLFSERTDPRSSEAAGGRYYDSDKALSVLGDEASPDYIFDDDELQAALADAGKVFLGAYARLSRSAPGNSKSRPSTDAAVNEGSLDDVSRAAASAAARSYFEGETDPRADEFLRLRLPTRLLDAESPQRNSLLSAFEAEQSLRIVLQKATQVLPEAVSWFSSGFDPVFPIPKFAGACRGVGLVSFERDASGGVLRTLPAYLEIERHILPQLGVAAALDFLGINPAEVDWKGEYLELGRDSTRRVPIDSGGSFLLNWHVPESGRWEDGFEHVAASRVLEIASSFRSMEENRRRLVLARAELLRLRHRDTPKYFEEYLALIKKRKNGSNPIESEEPRGIEIRITALEKDALVWLEHAWRLWDGVEPKDEGERTEKSAIQKLHRLFVAESLPDRLATANRELSRRVETLQQELGTRVEGKICLVGHTASGVADLVSTPFHAAVPGVMAHANVVNMLLQDRFLRGASGGVQSGMVFLLAAAVTFGTSRRAWWAGLSWTLALILAFIGLGAWMFHRLDFHLPTIPAVAVGGMVWAGVTLFRQATEERTRRRFERALGQYTSPAVASRIAAQSGVNDFQPQSCRVTCFFSDLQGFTTLSERLGPAGTREALNPYLERVSALLVKHGAIVNKFIGDGVFAFFNAPIRPCPGHADAACRCAREVVDAVSELSIGRESESSLRVRIGLSTGEAFVGDYGSETKLDYTCIGDTVNVGSRLEQVCKEFGVAILVDGATRDGAGNVFSFRELGLVRVEGRQAPVQVHELGGAIAAGDARLSEFSTTFERAVRCFQHCEWDECDRLLSQCDSLRPNDGPVRRYHAALAEMRKAPGTASFDGALTFHRK